MTEHDRFVSAFKALTAEDEEGYAPFRWQQRLYRHLVENDLPRAVDIPTGLGKTAVMALWLIALAEGARLPRRLVYIVDRRAVVDQATRFAEQIRRNLTENLGSRLGLGDRGLPISTLRGGFADNRNWLEDPASPAIIVGTIDMIGSRLLFEGYGVSRRMRPYHAGFLGVDTLVLLDEAHLCPPFEALLRQIERERSNRFGPNVEREQPPQTPPFRLMSLSATGRDDTGQADESLAGLFSLEAEDYEEPLVQQRLKAGKQLRLSKEVDEKEMVRCIAEKAIELGADEGPRRVLVYCHSRKRAVAIKDEIDKEGKRRLRQAEAYEHVDWQSELLVGERRVYERTQLEKWLLKTGFLGGSGKPPEAPVFLVATSAGEVGVDLDADDMVCDLVPFERMVQRLGRVNRRGGEHRTARIEVFVELPTSKASAAEKAEQEVILKPWCLEADDESTSNVSPAALVKLKSSHPEIIEAATTKAPLYPELTRPLLDAWAMTSLDQHEGRPEVAPWLRGWEKDEEPNTDLVWRKYLPFKVQDDDVSVPKMLAKEYFQAAPIHASERLEATTSHVFDWLLKRAKRAKAISKKDPKKSDSVIPEEKDVVAILIDRNGDHQNHLDMKTLGDFCKPAKDMKRETKKQKDEWKDRLLLGRTLVVDARLGGLQDGMLADKSAAEVPSADADDSWRPSPEDVDHADEERPRPIRFLVESISSATDEEGLKASSSIDGWLHVYTFETHFKSNGVVERGLAVFKWSDETTDEGSRSISSKPQSLSDHAQQVADCAREMAKRLELPGEEVEALATAAQLHDNGKAVDRWQDAMAIKDPKDGRPYAKTSGGGNWRRLEGYRHEFGSLLKANELEDLPAHTRDLILHLIVAHHGYARPLIRTDGCDAGPPSLLKAQAGEVARRFVRLQKRYGPWGLAWREAILRAADQRASRDWEEQSKDHG